MHRLINALLIATLALAALSSPALAMPAQSEAAIARGILFWSNGCPHCETVLLQVLPSVQNQYGSQVSILLIELVSLEDIEALYQAGAVLGLAKEQVNLPMLVLGQQALVGAVLILEQLPGLIESHLAAGGVGYPSLSIPDALWERGVPFADFDPAAIQTAQEPVAEGFDLAWVVMGLMALALLGTAVVVVRAFMGHPLPSLPAWVDLATPLLCLVGLGVALYLSYVETTATPAVCGPVGDCNAVQSSPYARLFGILPIGVLGVMGYLAISAAWLWRRYHKDSLAELAAPAAFGMTAFGTLFSVYLTYLEIFVIRAVCLWCLSSAVIMTLLMLVSLGPLMPWISAANDEDEEE